MSINEFLEICGKAQVPSDLAKPLLALWWDARGDWDRAHTTAQEIRTSMGSLVHAYLHRKEGDLGNAQYWYDRAGRPPHAGTLEKEWRAITTEACE